MAIHPQPSAAFKRRLLRISQQPQYLPDAPTSVVSLRAYLLPRLGLAGASVCCVVLGVGWLFAGSELSVLYESQTVSTLFVGDHASGYMSDIVLGWHIL